MRYGLRDEREREKGRSLPHDDLLALEFDIADREFR